MLGGSTRRRRRLTLIFASQDRRVRPPTNSVGSEQDVDEGSGRGAGGAPSFDRPQDGVFVPRDEAMRQLDSQLKTVSDEELQVNENIIKEREEAINDINKATLPLVVATA